MLQEIGFQDYYKKKILGFEKNIGSRKNMGFLRNIVSRKNIGLKILFLEKSMGSGSEKNIGFQTKT